MAGVDETTTTCWGYLSDVDTQYPGISRIVFLIELIRGVPSARKLRLSGMADVLDTRLHQAQTEQMAPIDLVAMLVSDELQRRRDRLLARRHTVTKYGAEGSTGGEGH